MDDRIVGIIALVAIALGAMYWLPEEMAKNMTLMIAAAIIAFIRGEKL